MKTLLFFVAILFYSNSFAQVEVSKAKSTITGKGSQLLEDIPDVRLDNFTVSFVTWLFGADEGGNNAKGTYNSVSATAELGNFDAQLAQEITDEAYLYYLDMWKARGLNVTCHSATEIEGSKYFAKDKEKGKAEIVAPGAYLKEDKYIKTLTVVPSNTVQVKKEYYGNYVYGNTQFFIDYTKNASSVAFNCSLNFAEFKAGFGTNAFLKAEPALKITSASSLNKSVKAKFTIAGFSSDGNGGATYLDTIDESNTWVFKINRENYKASAIDLIKKSIDSHFAEYDTIIAKEKG